MIQFRRGTASAASTANEVLAAGQPFVETDTSKLKIGDGSTAFNDLPYIGGSGGKKYATVVVGTSTAGYTADQVDFLCDGVDDQVEIGQALDAVASGGLIKLLSGQYKFTETFDPGKSGNKTVNNVEIVGEGFSTILDFLDFHPGYTGGACGFNLNGDNISFRNLHVVTPDSQVGINTMYAVVLTYGDNISIENCLFEGYVNPLNLRGNNNLVSKCRFLRYGYGFQISGKNSIISECIFMPGNYNLFFGSTWSNRERTIISNCIFQSDYQVNSLDIDTDILSNCILDVSSVEYAVGPAPITSNCYVHASSGDLYAFDNSNNTATVPVFTGNILNAVSGVPISGSSYGVITGNHLMSTENGIGSDGRYLNGTLVVGNLISGTDTVSGGSGTYVVESNLFDN